MCRSTLLPVWLVSLFFHSPLFGQDFQFNLNNNYRILQIIDTAQSADQWAVYDYGDGYDINTTFDTAYHNYGRPGVYDLCMYYFDYTVSQTMAVDTVCKEVMITGGIGNAPNPQHMVDWSWAYTKDGSEIECRSADPENGGNDLYKFADNKSVIDRDTASHAYTLGGSTRVAIAHRLIEDDSIWPGAVQTISLYRPIVLTPYPNDTNCVAKFEILQDSSQGNRISILNKSQNRDSTTEYLWSFGHTSMEQNYNSYSRERTPTAYYSDYGPYTVCLTINDDKTHCIDNYCETINFDSSKYVNGKVKLEIFDFTSFTRSASISQLSTQVSIYPNPASQRIFIECNHVISNVKLMDMNGAIVKTKYVKSTNEVSLKTSDIPSGTYTVLITLSNAGNLKRLISVQ